MTAVEITPVEIWVEIIKQILDDPALFRTNPFYPGCDSHTAVRKWYDQRPAERYKVQRGILRLVSHSWKSLVDNQFNWLFTSKIFDLSQILQSHWKSAKRMHLGVELGGCKCGYKHECICVDQGYSSACWTSDTKSTLSNPRSMISALDADASLLETLILAPHIWDAFHEELPSNTISHLFFNLRSLEIPEEISETTKPIAILPDFLPRLSYLSLDLKSEWGETQESLRFPNLITLKLGVTLPCVNKVQTWILPRLQHLEVVERTGRHFHNSMDSIFDFLRRGWPFLITLRLIAKEYTITLPYGLWNNLPRLEYLGCTTLRQYDDNPVPINHPLHTLALLDTDKDHSGRERIVAFTSSWPNLKVLADFHRWEDVVDTGGYPTEPPGVRFRHFRESLSCTTCIEDVALICEERGLRYVDRRGRTREEFKAGSALP